MSVRNMQQRVAVWCLPLVWAVVVGLPSPAAHQSSLCLTTCTLLQNQQKSQRIMDGTDADVQGCTTEQQSSCKECLQMHLQSAQADCSRLCSQRIYGSLTIASSSSSCQEKCACSKKDEARSSASIAPEQGQKPQLLCRDVNENGSTLVLAFPSQKNVRAAYYRLQNSKSQWKHFEPSLRESWIRLENLSFSESYEVSLYSEDDDSVNGSFSTLDLKHEPSKVREVHVWNYVSGADGALYANISWTPAADKPCCYSVYINNTNIASCELGKYWFAKHKVNLGQPTAFMVQQSFSKARGGHKYNNIRVPYCPDNLTDAEGNLLTTTEHCKTAPVEQICGMEHRVPGGFRIDLSWKAGMQAKRAPRVEAYILQLFTMNGTIISTASIQLNENDNNMPIWSTVVSTDLVKTGYRFRVYAESLKGKSDPVVLKRWLNKKKHVYEGGSCPPSGEITSPETKEEMFSNNIPQTMPVMSAGAGIVVVAVCIFVVGFVSHKKRNSVKRRQREDRFNNQLNNAKLSVPVVKRVNSAEEKLNVLRLGHKLGEGHFGIVYKAEMWQPEQKKWAVVAVKTLKCFGDEVARSQFGQESTLMKEVGRHPHVVSLMGEGQLPNNDGYYMAVEFCERGDLLNFLRAHYLSMDEERAYVNDQQVSNNLHMVCNQGYGRWNTVVGKTPLTAMDLMSFARQIALAMEYLSSIRIVHRDLAARNVLVTSDLQLKVADFGLSRDVYEGSIYFKHQGPASLPLRWMALEAIERSMYTSASDVWSFGVLLWEIWTMGKEPYAGLSGVQVLEALKQGHRLAKPEACPVELYKLMLQCWSEFPLSRPTFGKFRAIVESMIEANSYLPVKECNRENQSSCEEAPLIIEQSTRLDSVD